MLGKIEGRRKKGTTEHEIVQNWERIYTVTLLI